MPQFVHLLNININKKSKPGKAEAEIRRGEEERGGGMCQQVFSVPVQGRGEERRRT